MAKIEVLNWEKQAVGEVELPREIFEQPVRIEVLHEMVRWQLACRRQGTHMTKTRGLVSGGGKKPFRQKGTGRARQGSIRSPLLRGGGVIFGPQPRSYQYQLPKKFKKLGLKTALSYLYANQKLFIVENMGSEDGKTKKLVGRLKGFGVSKAVLISARLDQLFQRSIRNVSGFRYYSADGLNVYDLLKYDSLIVAQDALVDISKRCGAY